MAKRVIIDAELSNLTQPWSGVNETSGTIQVGGTDVPAGAEWGYKKSRVEALLKTQLESKGGAVRWELPSGENFYYLLLFKSSADATAWDSDQTLTNYIDRRKLPLSAENVDTYSLSLSTSRTGSTVADPIVVQRGRDFNVPLRVLAWHYPPNGQGDVCNYDRQPAIIVKRRTSSTAEWVQVGSFGVSSIAESQSDNTFPNILNIGSLIDTGSDSAVQVQFTIPSYVYTNAAGEQASMVSNSVVIYLRTVTLAVSMSSSDWLSPIRIADSETTVPVKFILQGNIAKTLHVKCTNASGSETYEVATQNVTATGEYNYNIEDNAGTLHTSDSGVHTVTAWLTYGSGADAIETEKIVHQILVLKPSTAGSVGQRVLVQQMAQKVDNFVQSVLCHYFVWNPKLSDGIYINDTSQNVSVRFIVADSPNLSEQHTEYVSLPVSVLPGTDCTLTATMEVETAIVQATYTARLHALSSAGVAMLTPSRQFIIDNQSGFQPTAGSVFHLNPKSRDNDETTPKSIINARNTSDTVSSVWSDTFKMDNSDGWVTDESGEKVLRVPAGRKLTIQRNFFNHFYTAPAPSKSMTLEIDFQVNNITNEDDPILQLCEPSGTSGQYLGLRLRPMVGTMGCVSDSNEATTDFRWAEGRREHLAVTITPVIYPNVNDDAYYVDGSYTSEQVHGSISLVRVYLNGVIVREIRYNPNNQTEFCTGVLSNLGIIIGQEGTDGRVSGADIDIYGIRVWESGLAPRFVLQNYVSALPGSTEKRALKSSNDLTLDDNSGRISLPKACEKGKNCMIWHGKEVMYGYGASGSERGWLEIRRYSYSGEYLPQYSGSFCKATKRLKGKGQGTTAMTYFYWNTQWKFGDVAWNDDGQLVPNECIALTPSQINSNIHLGTPVAMSSLSADDQNVFANVDTETYTHVCPVYGGNLGKDEPVGTATKYYPCTVNSSNEVVTILLPDGWINGSGDLYDASLNPTGGKYCGQCWQADSGLPYGSKHVLKINYASSMQSHLIGVNWLYNALHREYCGANSLQRDTPSAVTAKQVVPVLFFTADKNTVNPDETDGTANFRGLGGFGPGKMDKPAWGYSKKASKVTDPTAPNYRPDGHDYFAMFEGAVNNSVLSDQIAPFDDTDHLDGSGNIIQRAKVKYWLHDPVNSAAKDPESFYYRHTVLQDGVEKDSWEKGITFDGGKTGRKSTDGLIYNSNSCDVPDEAPSAAITGILRNAWNYAYLHNPNIRYFNGTQDQLAAAELTEAERKRKWITNDSFLLKRWDFCERQWVNAGLWNTSTHAYDQINIFTAIGSPSEIQDDRPAVVAAYIAYIVDEARPTNAGETDGIGAYFKAKSLRFHYVFQNHFIAGTDNCSKNTYYVIDPVTHLIELHQDDVDTTLATDNFGFQTKPYYVDRMNPWDDNDTVRAENQSCYDGMLNTLFDLVEKMWEPDCTLANALASVLADMSALTGGIGSTESAQQSGVWRSINRYLFDIQRYFPQVCFNEAARIRYEFPAMLGFIGRDGEADPLAQSMGDQLEAEIQFMKRRLIYMASYAGFGEFSASVGGSSGSIGISDAGAQLSVNSVALPNGGTPNQTFTVVPHQYLFPVFTFQSQTDATRHRTAPGQSYTHTTTFQFSNTYPISLRGLNYYRSVGNLGDKTINSDSFSIQGSRLTEFIAEPTTYYSTTQGGGSISKETYDALPASQKANYAPAFARPNNLQIGASDGATRLRTLSLRGCTSTGSTSQIPFNLSRLSMVESIDLRDSSMQAVTFPETSTLTSLKLPATLTSLSLTGQPSLATLDIQGCGILTQLTITGSPLLGASSLTIIRSLKSAGTVVTLLDLKYINWTAQPIEAEIIEWLLGIGDRSGGVCLLEGRISVVNGEFGILTFYDVCKLIERYGDVRDNTNSLYVQFAGTSISQQSVSISGKKYINTDPTSSEYDLDLNDCFDGLGILVASGNDVAVATKSSGVKTPNVVWELTDEGASTYAEFPDQYSPVLHLKKKGAEVVRVTLHVRVTLTNTSNETRIAEKVIGLWNRLPEVGDYAWTDGQFDEENDASKQCAGMVIKRDQITLPADETHEQPYTAYKLTVLSAANPSFNTSAVAGGFESSWGLYPDTSAVNGFTNAKTDGQYNDPAIEAVRVAIQNWTKPADVDYNAETGFKTDIFNTPLKNMTGDKYIRKNAAAVAAAGNGIAMQDEGNSGNGGYATYAENYMNNFETEEENAVLLSYADAILGALYGELAITQQDWSAIQSSGGCTSAGIPLTTQGLWQIAEMIVAKASAIENMTAPARFREFLFMAFRRCKVWCPADIDNSLIDESKLNAQYARGKWMLPSSGLLARIYNFYANSHCSSTSGSYNSSDAPLAKYAEKKYNTNSENNDVALEALKPLFANAIAKGRAIPISNSSPRWSSTESTSNLARYVNFSSGNALTYHKYSGYVVRPVAAFIFVP